MDWNRIRDLGGPYGSEAQQYNSDECLRDVGFYTSLAPDLLAQFFSVYRNDVLDIEVFDGVPFAYLPGDDYWEAQIRPASDYSGIDAARYGFRARSRFSTKHVQAGIDGFFEQQMDLEDEYFSLLGTIQSVLHEESVAHCIESLVTPPNNPEHRFVIGGMNQEREYTVEPQNRFLAEWQLLPSNER